MHLRKNLVRLKIKKTVSAFPVALHLEGSGRINVPHRGTKTVCLYLVQTQKMPATKNGKQNSCPQKCNAPQR